MSGEREEGQRCMSAEGSSVKGSTGQSWTSGPKVKGQGPLFPLFSGLGHWVGGLKNDTTPGFGQLSAISDAAPIQIKLKKKVHQASLKFMLRNKYF